MTWKRRSTSSRVTVELYEFEPGQLLQGLIEMRYISEDEAEAVLKRGKIKAEAEPSIFKRERPDDELDAAFHEITLGRRVEALIHLERALGREWIGRLTQ